MLIELSVCKYLSVEITYGAKSEDAVVKYFRIPTSIASLLYLGIISLFIDNSCNPNEALNRFSKSMSLKQSKRIFTPPFL